ncbi:MAG: DUF4367 domain-containing protein [Lachnospiraceae bacterium]|nr:DUF4367 domain-containing protein [Lachnospiraceae bacterium]
MNSDKSLSGKYLKQLYIENKNDNRLSNPDHLKKLLNYELDFMGDTADCDFEIIDFCVNRLQELEPPDEQKIAFLGQKLSFEEKTILQKQKIHRIYRWAIAATLAVIVGITAFQSTEGFAGRFDFVHRLITHKNKGQLSMKSPDLTLQKIEIKARHLPASILDEYIFEESSSDSTPLVSTYRYVFKNMNKQDIHILIKEYPDRQAVLNNELEIDKRSSKTVKIDGIPYYYSENLGTNSISWPFKNTIFNISGSVDVIELEHLLSLYRKEQNYD